MNRRRLIQLSLMAALAPAQQLQAASKSKKSVASSKKGLGFGPRSPDWSDKLKELNCKWVYTWMEKIPDGLPKEIAFVPMISKSRDNPEWIANAGDAAKKAGIKELLGFNEPDQSSQANMTVEEALAAWPLLQETGLRLGSPACVHPDNEWMQSFMKEAKKRDFKVDFICVHSYGAPNAGKFVERMQAIHKLYRKPIWITEFAIGDWKAKSPAENQYKPDAVLGFMEDVLPELEKLDFIERYAWFPAKVESAPLGTSALFDGEGKLTRLGECYRDA
jgi:hypothetical protein